MGKRENKKDAQNERLDGICYPMLSVVYHQLLTDADYGTMTIKKERVTSQQPFPDRGHPSPIYIDRLCGYISFANV